VIRTVAVTLAALAAIDTLVFGGQYPHFAHNFLRYVF